MSASDAKLIEQATRRVDCMSKVEKSQLLYLEACAVDYSGRVQASRMNKEDFEICSRWSEEGFVRFTRMRSQFIDGRMNGHTHGVILSDLAFQCAAIERKRRARCTVHREVKESIDHFEKVRGQ